MTRINLPEDLLVEILSKVPAISLTRFRTTSKGWNTLIRDGRLAKKHYASLPKQSLVILLNKFRVCLLSVNLCGVHNNISPSVKITSQLRLKDPLSSSSEEVEVDIHDVFHCEGLLLCTTKDNNRRVVWNPCTGKTMWLQPRSSCKDSDYYTIGYDKKSSCYKILRMDTFHIEYEVYDVTSNSWKNIHETRDWSISQMGSHVSVEGNTYWLGLSKEDPSGIILLSFDFSTERFRTVSLPEDPKGHFNNSDVALSVTREGQQLCMLATQVFEFTETNIWVATKSESTGAMSWSKFLTVSGRNACYRPQPNNRMSFLVDQENKAVLSCNNNRFSNNRIHIVGEDKYIEVYHTDKSSIPVLLSYVPSLVQI